MYEQVRQEAYQTTHVHVGEQKEEERRGEENKERRKRDDHTSCMIANRPCKLGEHEAMRGGVHEEGEEEARRKRGEDRGRREMIIPLVVAMPLFLTFQITNFNFDKC